MEQNLRGSLNVVQHLVQRQLQRLHRIRVVGIGPSARVIRQLQGARPRLSGHDARTIQHATWVGDIIDDSSCMPSWGVEHHARRGLSRFRG